MTDSRFNVNKEEFDKAGLDTAGSFLFRIDAVKGAEKTYGEGDPIPVIQMKLVATHTVEFDEITGEVTGEVELDQPFARNYEEFKLEGKSARKLQTLYQAITGRRMSSLNADGEEINTLQAAEELLGGSAWNNVFHTLNKWTDKETGEARQVHKAMITNTFKSKPPKRVTIEVN
jgi:hypothetical protein